jgi:hypothetical protein
VQLLWKKYYDNGKLPNHTMKGSFWWRDILRLLPKFKSLATITVHKGDTCFLWHDLWGGSIRSQGLPHFFFICKTQEHFGVQSYCNVINWPTVQSTNFRRGLPATADLSSVHRGGLAVSRPRWCLVLLLGFRLLYSDKGLQTVDRD